ncbi:M23 family metallopeptidase [Leptospira jelokensis]|uniref:M23 family metallopeptidase n=1 Tax=Leptospira jelokensis TaxID=2484931 RepID=A0A4Z0ZYJ1_9LEPT|nr:M23 family metallopeptidase [Leptospira jelokensis]TGL59963.1 M23 family metallopeptidase [Leptospira jelokensis]TGM01441.1 M23 family metallopeptidase [Leptospira jelokensis]
MKKFILFLCFFVSGLYPEPSGDVKLICLPNHLCTYLVPVENGFDFFLVDQSANVGILRSVELNLSVKNLKTNLQFPQYYVIRNAEPILITRFIVEDESKETFYSFSALDYWGDWDAVHDDRVTYSLPFAKGIRARIGQGYNGKFTHYGNLKYSLDFILPIGTPIHSSRKGRVAEVVKKYSEGGLRKDLFSKANFILIQHDDGTLGNYVHLKKDGAVVNVGDYVEEGQLIGYSGNTGYSDGPHLHFEVQKPSRGATIETIPTFFKTQFSDREYLNHLYLYWHPVKGIDPPNSDLLEDGILLCRVTEQDERFQCNDTKFRLGEQFALKIDFIRPTSKQVELFLSIDTGKVEPYYKNWQIQKSNIFEYQLFKIPKNRNFVGNWQMLIKVDGVEKKKFFYQVLP